jgi:hypothetical protein
LLTKEVTVKRLFVVLSIPLVLLLAACGGEEAEATATAVAPTATTTGVGPSPLDVPTATQAPTPTQAAAPTAEPMPPETESPLPPPASFEAAAYRDESAGFELDYPASWTLDAPQAGGDRGYYAQFTSWEHAPGDISAETPPGGSRMDVTVLLWDPKNDLTAFMDTRKQAWAASGMTIVSEEEVTLAGDHPAVRFVMQTQVNEQAFFLFTTIGERYLQVSGTGDLALLAQIAQTVRLLPPAGEPGEAAELDCSAPADGTAEWVACNVADGIRSRNLSTLHSYMADPFLLGYWGSEARSAPPDDITAELAQDRLPADPSTPMTFTADRSQFPPLAGQPPETMFGPAVNVAMVIYSEGWGEDGLGAALLYIAQNDAGGYYLHGMVYSPAHFDK